MTFHSQKSRFVDSNSVIQVECPFDVTSITSIPEGMNQDQIANLFSLHTSSRFGKVPSIGILVTFGQFSLGKEFLKSLFLRLCCLRVACERLKVWPGLSRSRLVFSRSLH